MESSTTYFIDQTDYKSAGVGRRAWLLNLCSLAALTGVQGVARPAMASEAAIEAVEASASPDLTESNASQKNEPSPTSSFTYDFPDDGVPSNLKPMEYYRLLVQLRPVAWAALARNLQSMDYDRLAISMNQAPMANLRAAAKFVPWSLLQADEYEAAVVSRKSFLDLEVHMMDLAQISEATAMEGATPAQVQQAFILLNASFEQFIATIPSKYQQV